MASRSAEADPTQILSQFGFTVKKWACSVSSATMANPKQLPPPTMAAQFGVGKLSRHLFICVGPDCVDQQAGEQVWDYVKKRMKQLNIAGAEGPCYRTKCNCLRICIAGPIAVVYPEGTWYQNVTIENAERIIQEHLIGGKVVDDICFARNALHPSEKTEQPRPVCPFPPLMRWQHNSRCTTFNGRGHDRPAKVL